MDFDDVYREYLSEVYHFLLRLSGDSDVAEEITQETFTKAYENMEKFRGNCKLDVWLCQIAKNTYFTYYNRQKKRGFEQIEGDFRKGRRVQILAPDNLEREVLDSLTSYEIHKILHKVAEPYKEVFMLRVFGELKFKEIAGIFEKTESWARVTYYRAKEMIQEQIEGGGKIEL